MSWLLFMDECGHDHRTMPYEVRGGVALHAGKVWPFVQDMQRLEVECFGDRLHRYGSEIKGHKLLDADRLRWADQMDQLDGESRRKYARSFLNKGAKKERATRIEFTAYGQACRLMATSVFDLLRSREAVLFASAIPRRVARPRTHKAVEFLRKDHVFLFERFFYFLEGKRDHGILVMDETEKTDDRRFVTRLQSYFQKTQTGRHRTAWIVPTPFFVSSEMTYPVQAADLCIYCTNWGFRLPSQGMHAATRPDIASAFGPAIDRLQFRGDGYKDGRIYRSHGIVYVPDPYTAR